MTLRNNEVLGNPEPPAAPRPPAPVPPRPRPAPLAWGILAVCVVMFLLQQKLMRPVTFGEEQELLPFGALFGPAVREGQWWRLLSYAFEHGSVLHIFFNGAAIWSLGTALERIVGTWRFAIISVAGTLGCAAFALVANSNVVLVGASGMILGWAGALLPVLNNAGRRSLGGMLLQVALISLLPNVSLAGHLGGFLFGVPFGYALKRSPQTFNQAAPVVLFLGAVAGVLAAR